ncbi:MAG: hypothetical protein NT027_08170 [Proteobacteria bacterium]|nr:hypothetical protein [Pseudomonadota bacterium]
MLRYRTCDVMVEMVDFAVELISESQQLVVYHKACTYKAETALKLNHKLSQIQSIVKIFNDDMLNDLLLDFKEIDSQIGQGLSPGECRLSWTVARMAQDFVPALSEFRRRAQSRRGPISDLQIQAMQGSRNQLLSVCRKGTRSWELLKNL